MALAGRLFALSATGVNQTSLEADIKSHGGRISRTIHKRVDFCVVTPLAMLNNTQSVRKVRSKFQHVHLVLPEFIYASATSGALCDPTAYLPESADPGDAVVTVAAAGTVKKQSAASLGEIGLEPGDKIDVRVEMSDEPSLQWWPATVQAPVPGGSATAYPLVYDQLLSRGYDQETPSRARFKRPTEGDTELPPDADGLLYDLDEGVWRPWRQMPARSELPSVTPNPPLGAAAADPSLALHMSAPAAEIIAADVNAGSARKKRKLREWPLRFFFKRTSAMLAFGVRRSVQRHSVMRRLQCRVRHSGTATAHRTRSGPGPGIGTGRTGSHSRT